MFREQLAHLINKADDMKVCGQTDNIRDGLALIKQTQPTIAIIDVTLRGSSGLELLKDCAHTESMCRRLSFRCTMNQSTPSVHCERAQRDT